MVVYFLYEYSVTVPSTTDIIEFPYPETLCAPPVYLPNPWQPMTFAVSIVLTTVEYYIVGMTGRV